jgi:preprotein translocase subunit SecG
MNHLPLLIIVFFFIILLILAYFIDDYFKKQAEKEQNQPKENCHCQYYNEQKCKNNPKC